MIAILPLRELSTLNELNAKEGINAHHAYCFYDGKEMQGYLLYSILDKQGLLLACRFENQNMLDGLVRAVLSSLLDASIDTASFSDKFDISTLRLLKIIGENEEKVTSITNLFYNCNGCKNCDAK